MHRPVRASIEDAHRLADLYAKGFEKTGLKKFALPEKRDELIGWIKILCSDGKIWFRCDKVGPVALGYYEEGKNEVVMIVKREGAEQAGHATAMLKDLVNFFPSACVRPVTSGGKALARKCRFSPSPGDPSLWVRTLLI